MSTQVLQSFTDGDFNDSFGNFENTSNSVFLAESTDLRMYISIVMNVISLSMCVLGLIQNVLSLHVLVTTEKEKTSTVIIFIGICVLDVVFIVAAMIDIVYTFMIPYFKVYKSETFIDGLRVVYIFVRFAAVILLSVLSIERMFAVLKPFEFRLIWTPTKAIYINVISYVLSFILSCIGNMYLKKELGDIVTSVYGIGILVLIPTNILTVCILCRSSGLHSTSEKHLKAKLKKERRLTKVLVILTLLFLSSLVCLLLICFTTTICDFNPDNKPDDIWYVTLLPLLHISGVIFSIFNSVIFVATNNTYRMKFRHALLCC